MLDRNMPEDPFENDSSADLTQWGLNCRAMFTALTAAGFTQPQALEITGRVMAAMMAK